MSDNLPVEVVDFFRGMSASSKQLDSYISGNQKNVSKLSGNVKKILERDIGYITKKARFTNEERQATMGNLGDMEAAVLPKNAPKDTDLSSYQSRPKVDLGIDYAQQPAQQPIPVPEPQQAPVTTQNIPVQSEQSQPIPQPNVPTDPQMEMSFDKIEITQVYDILEAIFDRIEALNKRVESLEKDIKIVVDANKSSRKV